MEVRVRVKVRVKVRVRMRVKVGGRVKVGVRVVVNREGTEGGTESGRKGVVQGFRGCRFILTLTFTRFLPGSRAGLRCERRAVGARSGTESVQQAAFQMTEFEPCLWRAMT